MNDFEICMELGKRPGWRFDHSLSVEGRLNGPYSLGLLLIPGEGSVFLQFRNGREITGKLAEILSRHAPRGA